ncbi:MAG: transporter [Cytophagales bacterium]
MLINKIIRLIGLCVFFINTINAQSIDSLPAPSCNNLCCGSDMTPAGVMYSHLHSKNEWMLSYRYQFMNMKNWNHNVSQDEVFKTYNMSTDAMRMHMHMLMLMYGISDRFTVMLMGHYMSKSMNMLMFGSSSHNHGGASMSHQMYTQGLADSKLILTYGLVNSHNHRLLISSGLGLPTGNMQLKGDSSTMYPNKRYPYMMQLGSGSFEFPLAMSYIYQNNKLSIGNQFDVNFRIRTNVLNYKWSPEINNSTWVAYKFLKNTSISLRAENKVLSKILGTDASLYYLAEPAANSNNYGGYVLQTTFGFNQYFDLGPLYACKLGLEAGMFPVQNLYGLQLQNHFILQSTLNLMF